MSDITDAIKQAIESANPGAKVDVTADAQPPAPVVALPPRVAANLCKLMDRVQVTGPEAIAWVEAVQILQQIAGPLLNATPSPGVPFTGLGK